MIFRILQFITLSAQYFLQLVRRVHQYSMTDFYQNNNLAALAPHTSLKNLQNTKQSILIYQQLSKIFKNISKSQEHKWRKPAESYLLKLKAFNSQNSEAVQTFINQISFLLHGKINQYQSGVQENILLNYWSKCTYLYNQQTRWKHSQLLKEGYQILKLTSQKQQLSFENKCRGIIKYNIAICLYRLSMYQQALKIINQLRQEQLGQNLGKTIQQLIICIQVRMGIKMTEEHGEYNHLKESQFSRGDYLLQLKFILSMDKRQLVQFLKNCYQIRVRLHINNWFNLALACKNKNLTNESIIILQNMTNADIIVSQQLKDKCYILLSELHEMNASFQTAIQYLQRLGRNKQIMFKIYCLRKNINIQATNSTKMQKALAEDSKFTILKILQNELKRVTSKEQTKPKQIRTSKPSLLKLTFTASNSIKNNPKISPNLILTPTNSKNNKHQASHRTLKSRRPSNKNFTNMFEDIKNKTQLNSFFKHKNKQYSKILSTTRKHTKFIPSTKQTISTDKWLNFDPRTTAKSIQRPAVNFQIKNHPPIVVQNQMLSDPKQISTSQSNLTNESVKMDIILKEKFSRKRSFNRTATQAKRVKKGVQFANISDSQSSSGSQRDMKGWTIRYQQKIITHIMDEQYEDALDEIKSAEDNLELMQAESKQRAILFTLKLSKWCRQAGKQRYATLMLKRVMVRYSQDNDKVILLKELSRHYQHLKEYKSAIETNLQLIKLGQLQYLDQLGQMYIIRQNYTQALKCYQRFNQMHNSMYSRVKLAHASSKISSLRKQALDILNEILFENKTSCIFKAHQINGADDFQSALLLLVAIYINIKCHKKAMEICEKYIQIDFGAYPVLYILGVIHLRQGNREEAFNYFLGAIRLKPNHLSSLLQLLNFIGSHSSQVLIVLRKAFLMHHRDWQLLQLLVSAASKTKIQRSQLSVQALIKCAKILEEVCEEEILELETQAVWLWAAQLIDERQKRMSLVDQEFVQSVYVKLGQISLRKGDYLASQKYFSRVLQKLQIEGTRLRIKPKNHTLRLLLEVLRRLAYIKSQQKDLEASMRYLQQSKEAALKNEMFGQAIKDGEKIGRLCFMLRRYQEAANEFAKCSNLIQLEPSNEQTSEKWKELQLKTADCYQNMRRWKEAKKVYQQILKNRICQEAIKNLANLYAWQGNIEYAKELQESLRILTQ